VKSLPGALATLNKNFIALSFAGVLSMLLALRGEGSTRVDTSRVLP
jgi:hypothetical protein